MGLGAGFVVTTIPVTDLDLAKQFYGNVLGLRQLFEAGPSIRWEAGNGSQISTFRRGPTQADHTVAHFEVRGLDALVAELEAKGVAFLDYDSGPLKTTNHITQIGPARGAWFMDPFGNILGLREEATAG
jgi:catechol 2,3-dioxygenase-like lactoylglutathione lyase family enzyme